MRVPIVTNAVPGQEPRGGQREVTRRRLLLGSAAVVAGLGVAGQTAVADTTEPGDPLRGALVEAPVDADDLPRWRADIDILAEHGLNLVRTGVYPWLVAPAMGSWDQQTANFYVEALAYARDRRLAVNLVVVGAPDWAQSYDLDNYTEACTWFWTTMAEVFDAQVDLWQVFNEADQSHYRRFTPVTLDAAYLTELGQLLGAARRTLGQHGTPVTTNLTGWPMNDERQQGWYDVLDVIGESLDVVSLDLYPADNRAQIDLLPRRIDQVHHRYGKPVFVAETGLQTGSDSWSEEDQRLLLPAAIEAIRSTDIWGVCLYQLRDQPSPGWFGIVKADGSPKLAFDETLRSLA